MLLCLFLRASGVFYGLAIKVMQIILFNLIVVAILGVQVFHDYLYYN